MEAAGGWQFWIDRGGTFTDIVGRAPDGCLRVAKRLSADGGAADPGVAGILAMLAREGGAGARIDAIRIGTTVATNALLERRGVPTALVTTAGFRDALAIGYQNRPRLFDLRIELPAPLYACVIEADERVTPEGGVLRPLDESRLAADLAPLAARGIESVAIAFMHGFRHPAHERRAAQIARAAGFAEVIASHEVSPLIRLVSRGDTTVVDAYLSPLLGRYVRDFRAGLGERHSGARLEFMQSNGGLAAPENFRACNAVLSGPAGGLVATARIAERLGRPRLIAFDMGGTSTDVALYDGALPQRFETAIAGVRLQAPMMNIHTVAAGGGSVLAYAGGRLVAGPESAGSRPGPACYRNGGPLAVTDVQVLLGRVRPDCFPAIFGPRGDLPLDADVVRRKFRSLAGSMAGAAPASLERLAAGFMDVAVESMARAIRHVSVREGHDPAEFALLCYGGAAPQHACRVADSLGIGEILVHPLAGVLSAWGIGLADRRQVRRQSVERELTPELHAGLDGAFEALAAPLRAAMAAEGATAGEVRIGRTLALRAPGTETELEIAHAPLDEVLRRFGAEFTRRFGFAPPDAAPQVATLAVEAVVAGERGAVAGMAAATGAPDRRVEAWFDGWREVPLIERASLAAGRPVAGPALVVEPNSTTVVEPGWTVESLADGTLRLARSAPRQSAAVDAGRADPAQLELFNHRFMQVAEQMGAVLQATAVSVNIRERLDFSCAVFDASGALIANAPHMPVHLGSMGASVRAVIAANAGALRPGRAWMLNAPYAGGTHLPDITVVSPVFGEGGEAPSYFVASRAHHADIGGITPGSMPPASRTIGEEGVVFDNFLLVDHGAIREAELRRLLASGPWPARNPDQNVADLKAQLAANARGAAELAALVARAGLDTVSRYMGHVQDNAEACVREVIGRLGDGQMRYEMDDGSAIEVRVSVDRGARSAVIDFAGTSSQQPGNFNAPLAVCTAAVLYVFRTLVDAELPLNEGCLRPLTIRAARGSMVNPVPPAAVVAGNVETSQCIVDALFGALGVLAASQGTMNNLTFGDAVHQYYETIAGGSGAGEGFDGASGVQTHMTNSRLTDPEVLESRHPVLVREFGYRRDSGGRGRNRGGDGLVRVIEFRAPMTVAVLSNHRRIAPFGLAGGGAGATGVNRILRADGTVLELPACAAERVDPGDAIRIETPGGGGFG
ncbi:MAG TPA: hydantoinase B/oxoprolinase family protein [Steroidobacteraceae bacterium]|nr:hydantoinase B/oxoprolinase family protein [Steroidobacteraceae bacterium]